MATGDERSSLLRPSGLLNCSRSLHRPPRADTRRHLESLPRGVEEALVEILRGRLTTPTGDLELAGVSRFT
jgi:hypothetical protein